MPNHSYYDLICFVCDKHFCSERAIGTCPHCGVAYQIVWPAIISSKQGERANDKRTNTNAAEAKRTSRPEHPPMRTSRHGEDNEFENATHDTEPGDLRDIH